MKTFSHLWQYLDQFSLEWETFHVEVVKKIKTHILCSVTFFLKSCRLRDNIEIIGGARVAANDNIAERCMLDYWGYTRASTRPNPYTHTQPPAHTHTHRGRHTQKYVPIIAFIRASVLRYTYIASLVIQPVVSFCPHTSCFHVILNFVLELYQDIYPPEIFTHPLTFQR